MYIYLIRSIRSDCVQLLGRMKYKMLTGRPFVIGPASFRLAGSKVCPPHPRTLSEPRPAFSPPQSYAVDATPGNGRLSKTSNISRNQAQEESDRVG